MAETVLRSLHLPTAMDEQLRGVAFALRRPKSDVIRWCINYGLSALMERMPTGSSSEIEHVTRELRTDASEEQRRTREAAIQKLIAAAQQSTANVRAAIATRILRVSVQSGARPGEILGPHFWQAETRMPGVIADWAAGLDFAQEQGWVEKIPGNQFRLTSTGFAVAQSVNGP
jgi:hypothetical protein